jgi:hypothetical protein
LSAFRLEPSTPPRLAKTTANPRRTLAPERATAGDPASWIYPPAGTCESAHTADVIFARRQSIPSRTCWPNLRPLDEHRMFDRILMPIRIKTHATKRLGDAAELPAI